MSIRGCETSLPWQINLLCPGAYQILRGHQAAGLWWMFGFVVAAPLIVPGLVVWVLALVSARRLARQQARS